MMNQADRQELEDRVHEANEDPYSPTDERIEEIKQRAFKEYSQVLETAKANAVDEKPAGRQKKRSILRRAAIAVALAVCFLAASMLYSALAPVTAANANNFVRRTSIWLNDQLHLGITFPEPVDDSSKKEITSYTVFSTLEEAAQNTDLPLVYLKDSGNLTLSNISANVILNEKIMLSLTYSNSSLFVICSSISLKNLLISFFKSSNIYLPFFFIGKRFFFIKEPPQIKIIFFPYIHMYVYLLLIHHRCLQT